MCAEFVLVDKWAIRMWIDVFHFYSISVYAISVYIVVYVVVYRKHKTNKISSHSSSFIFY